MFSTRPGQLLQHGLFSLHLPGGQRHISNDALASRLLGVLDFASHLGEQQSSLEKFVRLHSRTHSVLLQHDRSSGQSLDEFL